MRVAIVCPYDLGRFGGVQDQAIKLARWLGEAGHDAWLVGPGDAGPSQARLVGPVTVVRANGAATPITLSPAAWRRTIEAVGGADVVHVHEPFMPVVSQAATTAPVATVGTFHADPTRAVRRLYRIGGPVLRRVARRLNHATAVSPVAAGPLRSLLHAELVPNGIDAGSYTSLDKVEHRVAFLGRPDPRKGLDVLLEAWPKVRSAVGDAELVVAGTDGPASIDGVRFIGRIDEDHKRAFLGRAAVFCAPNTGGESFGIVLAEAMASECAVVASGLPGFVHVAGDAALFVPPGDVAGLSAALVTILRDGARREDFGAAGKARVERFDAPAVVAGYTRAYEAAISAHN